MISIKLNKIAEKFKIAIMIIGKVKNWPVYFLVHFKIIREEYIIYYLRSGEKIKVRSVMLDWWGIFCEVFVNNSYNPKGFEIKKGDVVLDIGAHIGIFSIFASKFASKVYSLEPTEDNFKLLKENIRINEITNIYPFEMAVSDKTGKKELFISNGSIAHSFYVKEAISQKMAVSTISLDDFITSNNISKIDFLKVDCEGSEYDIILNCPKKVLSIIDKMSMECHEIDSNWNVLIIRKFLENNGFTVETVPAGPRGLYYLFAKK